MNNLSVVCHTGHVYELLSKTKHAGWYRITAGTLEHVDNYCDFMHYSYHSLVYNTLEEFVPCDADILRYKKELKQMIRNTEKEKRMT